MRGISQRPVMLARPAKGVAVAAASLALEPQARAVAAELALPLVNLGSLDDGDWPLLLLVTPERLELRETGAKAAGPVYVDFSRAKRPGGALARAVGRRGAAVPSVLDATAGLGQDAFLLASLGCSVTLLERSAVVVALLADGLARAAQDETLALVTARMTLMRGDALEVLAKLPAEEQPDVIYLDPMYPPSGKVALKSKEMRIFRNLLGDDSDAPELLRLALSRASKRVVVKRPQRAPPLGGLKPDATIPGKTTRFDLYLRASQGGTTGLL